MATNEWARDIRRYQNVFRQSAAQLVGIAAGLVADQVLTDAEIQFLHDWLEAHEAIACAWPGNIVLARVHGVLADGLITEEERQYLLTTLQDLVGSGTVRPDLPEVAELAFDNIATVEFPGRTFCLTGEFVYAPRKVCERTIVARGGATSGSVIRALDYLVVGSLGSPEWKHGSFGTKIDRAVQLKAEGFPVQIVKEDVWAAAL